MRESLAQEPKAIGWCQKSRGGIPAIHAAHTIALDPNNRQSTCFAKAARTTRFAYNWTLTEWQMLYTGWKAEHLPTQALAAFLTLSA
ncbi:helix-turn-helix domain-containing protein [Candidatus Methylacidiphilum fumarolicum]|uniref:helix-turn-helix domain-containing protein n=1 Tax=Candidatus Methylacidiphilum fumarolicum TaxID=591154 RepID=UPI0034D95CFE